MLFEGKSTFTDFTESTEAIATNILASRLKSLGEFGILNKTKRPENKKTNIYYLTDKGLALTPTIMELTFWSKDHLREFHVDLHMDAQLNQAQRNKEAAYKKIIVDYKKWRQGTLPWVAQNNTQ